MSPDFIDVSANQSPKAIDWPRVGAAGLIGMYARAGVGKGRDPTCHAHLAGGAGIGRPRGVYWYWQPEDPPEVQAEALAAVYNAEHCELAPVVDAEDDGSPRHHQVPSADLPALLMRFLIRCDALIATGVRTAIYTGPGFWKDHFKGDSGWAFRNRMLWIAHYGVAGPDVPWPWDEYALWQYAANTIWSDESFGPKPKDPNAHIIAQPGVIDGFSGEIDCDVLGNCSVQDLIAGTQPLNSLDYTKIVDRQRACRRQGCDPGALDGNWGTHSRAALVLMQRKLGIAQNGQWSHEVEEALDAITK